MAEKTAYSQAVNTGKYDKSSSLLGKYDNVRRCWEDATTSLFLAPFLKGLTDRQTAAGRKLRVLDLGCGSADGYELLLSVPSPEENTISNGYVIDPGLLERYIGLDINRDLLDMAEAIYGALPTHKFVEADLTNGLPPEVGGEKSFDLYSTTYGTLSHFHDEENAAIIADIAKHAADGSIFVGDWLGRYSYEWQDLWGNPPDQEYFMDYRISYIYSEEARQHADIASFPLRLMTRQEILAVIDQAARQSGITIEPLAFFDRSILIGRHMDTGDYNANCPKMRINVNSLFEPHLRTDLSSLKIDHVPRAGYDELNSFFDHFFTSVNDAVACASLLFAGRKGEAEGMARAASGNKPLAEAMQTMIATADAMRAINWVDARADFLEPLLGYCLRKLEMELQPGSGVGHGLVGIFQIRK
jgi:SAM-dependent methyltransferase